jgi:hypothetical protein
MLIHLFSGSALLPRSPELQALDAAERAAVLAETKTLIAEDYGPFCPLPWGRATSPEAAERRRRAGPLMWVYPLVPAAMAVAAFAGFQLLTPSSLGWSRMALLPLLLVVQLALSLGAMAWILRRVRRPYLAEVLRRRGEGTRALRSAASSSTSGFQ